MTCHKIKSDICHFFLKQQQVTNSDTEVAFISNILRKTTEVTGTGKSLLEALIFASTNPQYDNRLFIELQVQHVHENSKLKPGENMLCTLDSGIDVAPGITVAPPPKNFHIMILILFYTNLGIAIIFEFFLSSKFFKN